LNVIHPLQVRIIAMLARRHGDVDDTGRSVAKIVEYLTDQGDANVSESSVARILRDNHTKSWITCREEGRGRRHKYYTLTEKGEEKFREAALAAKQMMYWTGQAIDAGLIGLSGKPRNASTHKK